MTAQSLPNRPLAGFTIIDLGQVYQGPYATFLMARAGADVIKVEPPGGESARARQLVNLGASFPFEMLNANKRSVTLNLKTAEGKDLLKAMVRKGDVLLENYAPGVMDRLGLGWSVMREVNPRLVYASATGFGLSGPDRDNLAMDLTIQAVSGILASTGFPDAPPVKAGPAVADFMGGVHLYAGVVTALLERERTGHGRLVEIAMQEAVYPTLASTMGLVFEQKDDRPSRTGNRHGGMSLAPYNVYPASDGYVALICVVDAHWANLLTAMGRDDLKGDERFATHADRVARIDETDRIVESWTSGLTRQALFEAARAHKFPCAPVREVREVMEDAHMHSRGMLRWIDHPRLGRVPMPDSPLRIHETDPLPLTPAPELGIHNADVFGDWLGVSDDELADYRAAGII